MLLSLSLAIILGVEGCSPGLLDACHLLLASVPSNGLGPPYLLLDGQGVLHNYVVLDQVGAAEGFWWQRCPGVGPGVASACPSCPHPMRFLQL